MSHAPDDAGLKRGLRIERRPMSLCRIISGNKGGCTRYQEIGSNERLLPRHPKYHGSHHRWGVCCIRYSVDHAGER